MNKSQQAGFTLIELVMVIVILGVLSAVALPKFVAVDDDAKQASVNGFAGALSSAAAINYAARKANASNGVAVAKCSDVVGALQSPLPSGFTVSVDSVAGSNTTVSTCELTGYTNKKALFTVTGT